MSRRWVALLVAVAAMAVQTAASAEPSPRAQAEIAYLLGVVGASGCDFNRNGSWYDAKRAEEHLRGKYEYLLQRDRVATAEEFIDRVAARSSITGKPYLIKCGAGKAVTSEDWLRAALARYRLSPGSR
jgi:hypothetical protein